MHIEIQPPNFKHLELIQDILFEIFESLSEFLLENMLLMHPFAPSYSVHPQEDAVTVPFPLFVKEYTHVSVLNLEARSLTSLEFLQATRIGPQVLRHLETILSLQLSLPPLTSDCQTSDKTRLHGGSVGPRF